MGSCCSGPSREASPSGSSVGPSCDRTDDIDCTSQNEADHTGATRVHQQDQHQQHESTASNSYNNNSSSSSGGPALFTITQTVTSKKMPFGAALHRTLAAHLGDVNGVAFGENTLATCGGDKTVRVWNLTDFTELGFSPLREHSYSVNGCTYSPVDNLLVTYSTDGRAVLWNVKVGDKIAVLTHPSQASIRVCRFSPSGNVLATGSDDETLCLWDLASHRITRIFEGHEASIPACAFSPDSAFIVCGDVIGHLRVYAVHGRAQQHLFYEMNAHDLGVTCCAFSPSYGSGGVFLPDAQLTHFLLATCGFDNNIKLWDFCSASGSLKVTLKLRNTLTGHKDSVMACSFSPDGLILASAAGDKTVRLWDPLKGEPVFTLLGHSRFVTSCAFSKDGKYLATGSNDKQVKVWRIARQDQLYEEDCAAASAPPKAVEAQPVVINENSQYYMKDVGDWDMADVNQWLIDLGMGQYIETFQQHAIDGTELATLTAESLERVLGITVLGHRNKLARTIQELKERPKLHQRAADKGVPDEFLCPITREIMKDPVIASDGFTYEKAAMMDWIKRGKNFSPMTNSALTSPTLTSNRSLKMLIERHLQGEK